MPKSSSNRRASVSTGARRTVVSVPIGVDYDRIQGFAADPTLATEQQRLIGVARTCAPRSSAWASIGSTTPRAFPSGWTRSTR